MAEEKDVAPVSGSDDARSSPEQADRDRDDAMAKSTAPCILPTNKAPTPTQKAIGSPKSTFGLGASEEQRSMTTSPMSGRGRKIRRRPNNFGMNT